jgi:hypothetical protein
VIKKRLVWKAATGPNDAPPTSYDVNLDGKTVGSTPDQFFDLDLDPTQSYSGTVTARDAISSAESDPLVIVFHVVGKPVGLDLIDVP